MGGEEPYDYKFVKWMIKEKVLSFFNFRDNRTKHINFFLFFFKKLAAIPVTAFVGEDSVKQFEKYIRLCFIKVRNGFTSGFYSKYKRSFGYLQTAKSIFSCISFLNLSECCRDYFLITNDIKCLTSANSM